jgi:cystathionine beta-lyase family protein involved in aluminum resistance
MNLLSNLHQIEVGADLIAGSLIKNPGGGLAKIGGYIAGRKDLMFSFSFFQGVSL